MKIITGFVIIVFFISFYCCVPDPIILPGDISGYVSDAETSEPIQAAKVNLDPLSDSTVTGIDGKYLLKNLTPGNYILQASAQAYEKMTKNVTVISANDTEIDFDLSKGADISISDTYLDFGLDSTIKLFTISNIGAGTFRYDISTSQNWITVEPDKGDVTMETDTIKVTIDRTGLFENKIEERVTITSHLGDRDQLDRVNVFANGVADQDGNYYGIVTIGTQTWLAESLRTGTILYQGVGPEATNNEKIEKCCYDNIDDNCDTYGGLYRWDEMMDYNPTDTGIIGTTQGICPSGWHISTGREWFTLRNYLGGAGIAGGALKATGNIQEGTGLWEYPNEGATNESGFTGLPGGMVINMAEGEMAVFCNKGKDCGFWASTKNPAGAFIDETVGFLRITYNSSILQDNPALEDAYPKMYVRCVKDPE